MSAITQIHFSRKVSVPGLGALAFHTRQSNVVFQLLCIYNSNRTFKDLSFSRFKETDGEILVTGDWRNVLGLGTSKEL